MTNPTSNFGWQMPTATDLVTNLPADFEVFGQAVDTDFVDLLGGSTGQVLSKTSNTDLDFTWLDPDIIPSTYSQKTASYTFQNGDQGNIFSMNAATTQQFNIPTDATFNFAIGTEINAFWLTGAGQPTVGASSPGTTTVISTGAISATPKLRVANSGLTCKKLAANSWIIFGDIV